MGCSVMCGNSKEVLPLSQQLNHSLHIARPELATETLAIVQPASASKSLQRRNSPSTGLSPGNEKGEGGEANKL